ncbi:MAG: V-type ATP synthase subunit K [Candidatus Omnitrophota bacterium]
MVQGFGDMNFSLTLAAMGSALGTGVAGMAAIGAWKKAFLKKKTAPFNLLAFAGAPLTQTFYGFLLRKNIIDAGLPADANTYFFQMTIGLLAGFAIGLSAYMQGKAAACACDAFAETGEGFAKYLLILGVIETVALLVMIFSIIAIPSPK